MLRTQIIQLNELFRNNQIGISFYQTCSPIYIDDSDKDGHISYWNSLTMTGKRGVLDVHLAIGAGPNNIDGAFYNRIPDGIFMGINQFRGRLETTLTHEIGHNLGLNHTHQFARYVGPFPRWFHEPVDRSRSRWLIFKL
jgi:hypothetical protein